jgi:hypothetical protein
VTVLRILILIVYLAPVSCWAQAWLPPKGEGSVLISYQYIDFAGHFRPDGSRLAGFQTRSNNVFLEVGYGVTDRLALSASLPHVNNKFTDKETPPFNLPVNVVDDGAYHGAFQDFRFEARYNVLRRPFVASPFFAGVIPSHGYQIIGEAAPGRHLREYLVGGYAGRLLNPVLPRAYVHGLYSYAFVERWMDIPLNRSNVDLAFGYFVVPSVSISFIWSRQWTHGGLAFTQIHDTPAVFLNHDRLVRSNFQHVGVGAGLALNKSVDLHGNFVKYVSGSNTHFGTAISVGVSWTFQTRRERASAPPSQASAGLRNGVRSSRAPVPERMP